MGSCYIKPSSCSFCTPTNLIQTGRFDACTSKQRLTHFSLLSQSLKLLLHSRTQVDVVCTLQYRLTHYSLHIADIYAVYFTPVLTMPGQSVLKHYKCQDPLKQTWQCLLCERVISGASTRRKIEHLLAQGTTIKACPNRTQLEAADQNLLMEERRTTAAFGIKLKLVYCYNNLRSLQKLRDGTGRAPAVEHGWMEREVDSDRDSDSDDE